MSHHPRSRRRPPLLILLPLLCLAACVEVEDHLTINADGSGSVTLSVTPHIAVRNLGARHHLTHQGGSELIYPPLSRQDCQALFPGDDFTITAGDTPRVGQPFKATITFASIDQLLASPYATARQLSIERDDEGRLRVQSIGGLANLARLAMLPAPDGDQRGHSQPHYDHERFLASLPQARGTWRLTLPAPVTSPEGAVDDRTVTWTTSYQEDHAAWRRALAAEQVASSDAAEMAIPASPLRLGRRPFSALTAGEIRAAQGVDEAAIIAATTVTPQQIAITRSFAYIIERHQHLENHTRLHMGFSLPRHMNPMRWGSIELTRAEDDQGRSLLPQVTDDRHGRRHFPRHSSYSSHGMRSSDGMIQHTSHIDLAVPARDSQGLAVIEGRISMQYPGAIQLIPIPEAVSADDLSKDEDSISLQWNVEALNASGIELRSIELRREGRNHSLNFYIRGDQIRLLDIQVFDADGLALPTLLQSHGGSWHRAGIFGIGAGPIHVALAVAPSGAEIFLPINATDLPLITAEEDQP